MTECDTGDVVLISFPFSDFSYAKRRPALVVSSNAWNSVQDDVIIAVISSKVGRSPFEYVLNEADRKSGGLRLASAVRCGNLYTVDKRLVAERIGFLDKKTLRSIRGTIRKIIS